MNLKRNQKLQKQGEFMLLKDEFSFFLVCVICELEVCMIVLYAVFLPILQGQNFT